MAIAEKVAERFPEPFMPPGGTEFAVDVVFHLVEHRLFVRPNRPGPPDLDNLLKPVLDTLFTSANVLGPTGVLVDANDTWVTDVRARKTEPLIPARRGRTSLSRGPMATSPVPPLDAKLVPSHDKPQRS